MQIGDKISDQPKIRVVIRKRPLNRKEIGRNEQDVVEVVNNNEVSVREQKYKHSYEEWKSISPSMLKNTSLNLTTHSMKRSPMLR